MIWPIITHALVAMVFFVAAFYAFGFLTIGAMITKCGTDTDHTLAQGRAGQKIIVIDSVCGLIPPWHNVHVYRVGANGKVDFILAFTSNRFHMPRVTWTPQGEPLIEVPNVRSLSSDIDVKSNVAVKFGRVL